MWWLGAVVAVWAIVADQATKLWALRAAPLSVLNNPDYALGSVSGSPSRLVVGTVVVIVLFGALAVALAYRAGVPAWIPGLALGGMVSNLIDRVRFGAVRDFVPIHGATVNVADLLVLTGVLVLLTMLVARVAREWAKVRS